VSRPLRLALVGFGSVGRAFLERLPARYGRVLRDLGVATRVTGIATAGHGAAIDPRGLPGARCLSLVRRGRSLSELHRGAPLGSTLEFIRRVPADVLVELTPLEPRSGEPATRHARVALRRGMHVVTANKGPVAFALRSLRALAARQGRLFLHEGAVMDGTPVFNLVERCLPGTHITGFRGVLNSTTTRILSRMEQGASFAAALREAQRAGVAEADPRNDIDGWDAAVKGCALANALMGASLRPPQARRRGISGVTPAAVRGALASGRRLRLVVRARRERGGVRLGVAPEQLPADDVLVSRGSDGVLVLETDLMREIGIWEGAGGVDQTAYAILADLAAIVRSMRGVGTAGARSQARGGQPKGEME
jgi:homoserine dehydrogenase